MLRRFRHPTIRRRIVTLTVVPVIALMALWVSAMVSVTGDLRALIRVQGVYEDFGTPVDTAVGQIQIERRLSAEYLGADEQDRRAVAALTTQQRATDRAVAAMREALGDQDRREDLSPRQRESLDAMTAAVDGLERLRERVLTRTIGWDRAVDAYTAVVQPAFDVQSTLTALQAGQLAREGQVVIELVRVREFVSREDALVAGARAAGRLTDPQYDALTATVEDRRVFHRTYVPDLPDDSRALFADFERSAEYKALTKGEDALLRAGAAGAGKAMAEESWRTTTDRAVQRYMLLCTESALNTADRGRDFAYREMVKAAIVGVLGLAAVGLSIGFSAAAGRRIARRLEELRDAADVLAARQLPEVMERLSAGEEVDAAQAAPPLDFGDDKGRLDEIGQVGHALNTARLAAVEAAVKQATLRRNVFAVLLTIARRNQALVHRQSKLVDTLERRTEDPDTLEDLFRIDHLTTRMRRHAEGLIILSGSAPGRRWRKPVPVVDVVASAVGEIEDYTRVVVPPMPAVGVGADAVADVVHLVAELVENATVFSPPHTQVTMRPSRARNGFVLEIDDRGLGMDDAELAEAHATLARPGDFNPAQDDRLGLYVVGRLAELHGIGVTLTRSPYGGTTAVVLLPDTILESMEPEAVSPPGGGRRRPLAAVRGAPEAGAAEDVRAGADDSPGAGLVRPVPVVDPVPAEPARPAPAAHPVPFPGPVRTDSSVRTAPEAAPPAPTAGVAEHVRSGADEPPRTDPARPVPVVGPVPLPGAVPDEAPAVSVAGAAEHVQTGADEPPRTDPAPAPDAPVPAASELPSSTQHTPAAPATLGGLPTRVRQASLAAPLRDGPPVVDETPERDLSAEEMRGIFGAFQRGLDRGRRGEPSPRTGSTDEGTDDHG
ncbi:nitrate- and nitrite sensing domain-containing protein [Streptomyces sp. NPDC051907]|uniref:sensor histidine kinase n=1 Tax=Streptomyces sp. NPDC051907 TaxID=3155284 RepID=UPI00343F889F